MRYVIYFSNSDDSDSLIAYSKEQMLKEIRGLLSDAYKITKVCRVVKGEYVPIDITPLLKEIHYKENKEMKIRHEDFEAFTNIDDYLPRHGDGDSMASQAATAVSKLDYRWFNDGDVFDNVRGGMEGWANDISGSANWLYNYVPETKDILDRIDDCYDEDSYTELLYDLTKTVDEIIPDLKDQPKVGDAYNEEGPFKFEQQSDDDWGDDDEGESLDESTLFDRILGSRRRI